eukprot:ctg_441.g246
MESRLHASTTLSEGNSGAPVGRVDSVHFITPLQENLRDVTRTLVGIVEQHCGAETAAAFEHMHRLSRSYDELQDDAQFQKLAAYVESLPGEMLVKISSMFSNLCNLSSIADHVHRIRRRRAYERGESSVLIHYGLQETFEFLVDKAKLTPQQIYLELCTQTVEMVLTAHPTQSVRRSLLNKLHNIGMLLMEMDRKDLTPIERALLVTRMRSDMNALWRTDEVRRSRPTPQDEARSALNVITTTLWDAVPRFLRYVDVALQEIGVNEPLPLDAKPFAFSSWAGGDRDGNPFVTSQVTWDVVLLHRFRAADLYLEAVETLMFDLSLHYCSDALRQYIDQLPQPPLLAQGARGTLMYREFWNHVPPTEPYRQVLAHVRDRMRNTRDYFGAVLSGNQPLADRIDRDSIYMHEAEFLEPLRRMYDSLIAENDVEVARGGLVDLIRRVQAFGLSLLRLDVRQEADRHTEAMDAITRYIGGGDDPLFKPYSEMNEEERMAFLTQVLRGAGHVCGVCAHHARGVGHGARCLHHLHVHAAERCVVCGGAAAGVCTGAAATRRAAAGDHIGAAQCAASAVHAAASAVVSGALAHCPPQRAGGDDRVQRQRQGRRPHHLHLGAVSGTGAHGAGGTRARRAAALLSWARWHSGARWRSATQGHPVAAAQHHQQVPPGDRAGRGDPAEFRHARAGRPHPGGVHHRGDAARAAADAIGAAAVARDYGPHEPGELRQVPLDRIRAGRFRALLSTGHPGARARHSEHRLAAAEAPRGWCGDAARHPVGVQLESEPAAAAGVAGHRHGAARRHGAGARRGATAYAPRVALLPVVSGPDRDGAGQGGRPYRCQVRRGAGGAGAQKVRRRIARAAAGDDRVREKGIRSAAADGQRSHATASN